MGDGTGASMEQERYGTGRGVDFDERDGDETGQESVVSTCC
jgi:hypothetical protein